jgi:2-polyprenyl-3-methyl-5-hydroxy-6-metoxy-1,4-benzoquinol methylase
MNRRKCFCCGSLEFGKPIPTDGGQYLRCLTCSSLFQENVVSGADNSKEKFEAEQSRFYNDDTVMLSTAFEDLQEEATQKRLQVIKNHLQHGTLFEVGPGNGRVMALLSENGYLVDAIEHSEVLAKAVETKVGLKVLHGDFDTYKSSRVYDAYMSFHVLEHVPDVLSHLQKAAEITRPGGFAFIATPHAGSLEHLFFGSLAPNFSTAHLQLFSKDGLRLCLQQAGWTVVADYTPEYPTSWLRVATSILRSFGNSKSSKPRGAYAAATTHKTLLAIKIFAAVTWPLRKLQEVTHTGNELFIVARRN